MGAQETVSPCTYLTQSHVGSLCRQAREEELAGKLRDMEVLRQGGALPPGGGQLQAELQQVRTVRRRPRPAGRQQ